MAGKSLSRQSDPSRLSLKDLWMPSWGHSAIAHPLFDICLLFCFSLAFHLHDHFTPTITPNSQYTTRCPPRHSQGLSYWWISHVSLKFRNAKKTEERWLKCLGKMNLGATQQNKVKVCKDRGGRRKEMALRWRNRICLNNADCNALFRGGHYELQGCMSRREQELLKVSDFISLVSAVLRPLVRKNILWFKGRYELLSFRKCSDRRSGKLVETLQICWT